MARRPKNPQKRRRDAQHLYQQAARLKKRRRDAQQISKLQAKLQARLYAKAKAKKPESYLTQIVTNPDRWAPVYKSLMEALDTKGMLRLCQLSRGIRSSVMAHEYDINHRLERFIKDPCAFRSKMGKTNSLIIGGFALQFFRRSYWSGSLAMAVTLKGLNALKTYLAQQEGYIEDKIEGAENFMNQLIEDPLNGSRMFWDPNTQKSCKLIRGSNTIWLHVPCVRTTFPVPLTEFSATPMANFINWNKAYSLYPHHTFLKNEMVLLRPPDGSDNIELSQWSKNGWKLRASPLPPSDLRKICGPRGGVRRVGDGRTWMIPLCTAAVGQPATPFAVLENYLFHLKRRSGPDDGSPDDDPISDDSTTYSDSDDSQIATESLFKSRRRALQLQRSQRVTSHDFPRFSTSVALAQPWTKSPYKSHALKYSYPDGPIEKLDGFFNRTVLLQHYKFKHETLINIKGSKKEWKKMLNGPLRYFLNTRRSRYRFEHPDGWDYWDDKLPELYQQFGIL